MTTTGGAITSLHFFAQYPGFLFERIVVGFSPGTKPNFQETKGEPKNGYTDTAAVE